VSGETPVLLVHGIWDSGAKLGTMRAAIERAGRSIVQTIDLVPNDGRVPLRALAAQVQDRVESLAREHGAARVDLVGFSMGALVSRVYLQRLGGKGRVRRFVSISGPHGGTMHAYALPFDGVREMRRGSTLLRELEADPDPWGDVEVHVLYTPYDLMIVPARSSELRGARTTTRIPVALHRFMIEDPRAVSAVARILAAPEDQR